MSVSEDASAPDGGEPTVLFVDDQQDLIEVFELALGRDYDVRTASDGEEALDRFGDHVDIAFLDRRMPGRHGDEVLEQVRDWGYDTPVVMMSAVDPEVEPPGDHAAYLTKPVDTDVLRDLIEEHATPDGTNE
jgi:CheY-like chemotaxis protein